MTVRMSSLPLARFCSKGTEIGVGAGRAAAMSTAAHALFSNAPEASALVARLTDEERDSILEWQRPADVKLGEVVLRYEEAAHEVPVAFTAKGMPCEHGAKEALTEGHLDMAWELAIGGKKVAYIGDLKKTGWTTLDGPDSLQLIAYGFAWALKHGCDAFVCGIWMLTEGEWHWGDLVWLDSDRAGELWEQDVAAASNTGGEYATGAHCRGCYNRVRCPAYLVAPGAMVDGLAILQRELTASDADTVRGLLLQAQAAKDAIKVVEDTAKEYAVRFGLKDPETGKVYKAVQCSGREGFDTKGLRKDAEIDSALEPALRYFKKGKPFEQWRWMKAGS